MPDVFTRNESLTVGTTSVQVADDMQGREGRVSIILRNNSPNAADIITIALGNAASVAGTGIILKQGEVWYDANDSGYLCWQWKIQAVCATANGVLAIMER